MATVINAGALDLVEATIAAGADQASARKWWTGELSRIAKDSGVELADLPISPTQVAELESLVVAGTVNDKLARQVIEGVLAGEGSPAEVVTGRGLAVVSDDGPLLAAIDEALAAQPDVADKIRGGKVQAAGAIVGAVMKATRGQADAGRVRDPDLRTPRRRGVAPPPPRRPPRLPRGSAVGGRTLDRVRISDRTDRNRTRGGADRWPRQRSAPADPTGALRWRAEWDYSAVNFSTARQASGNSPAARATLSRSPTRKGVTPSEIALEIDTSIAAASQVAPNA